jgi:phage terminase large subunit-like protein
MSQTDVALDWIAAARLALMSYARLIFPGYEANWHHEVVADRLEAVERGEIGRLIVSEPNRYGKTLECSILFASWFLGHNPEKCVMLGSYSDRLAAAFGKSTRDIMESNLYKEIFPHVKIRQDSRAANDWHTTEGGGYYSVGRGGSAEGKGYDLLLVDDLIKNPTEAESETYQKQIWDFFISVLKRRANNPDAAMIIPMTRWNGKDIIAKILATAKDSGEEWTVLNFPAEAIIDEEWTLSTGRKYTRKRGEPLWEARHNKEQLKKANIEMGRWWMPRFQQVVTDESGAIIKREWLEKWEYEGAAPTGTRFVSIDSAYEIAESADYSAFGEYVEAGEVLYKTNQWFERMEFGELEDFCLKLWKTRPLDFFLIEAKGSGISLIQVLNDKEVETNFGKKKIKIISTKEVYTDAKISLNIGKREKGDIAQSYIRLGEVRHPKVAPWKEECYSNLCVFPNMPHDDIYDEEMQAIIYAKKKKQPKRAGAW